MKTAVASLVRNHLSYSALSRSRSLSRASPCHAIRSPVVDAQRASLLRRTITSSALRFQSTDSKTSGEGAFGLRTSTDTPLNQSALDQSTSKPSTSEQSASQQPVSKQSTSEQSASEHSVPQTQPSTYSQFTQTWLDNHLSSSSAGEEPLDYDDATIDDALGGLQDGSKGPFREQGLDPNRPARGRKPPQRAARSPLEPRLQMAKRNPEELGFTPRPLTAPRGETFAAKPYTEEEEVIRPLTDRHMGSQQLATPDDQAKAEIAARKAREPSYQLTFTCAKCQCCSTHLISKQAYHGGTVIVNCPDCKNKHLISDHLGIFSDRSVTLEDIMKEKGQFLRKGVLGADGNVEFADDNVELFDGKNKHTPT